MPKTVSRAAVCWPDCSAEMAAAPAAAAVLGDLLWCLGLGCLLGAGRQLLGLVLGEGPVRCFCWDVLAFAAAAFLICGFSAGVSASGLARWYMALGMLAGALAWNGTTGPAIRQLLHALGWGLLWPFRTLERRCLAPIHRRLTRAIQRRREKRKQKKAEKKPKNGKKQLQKPSKIVYN